MIRQWKHPHKNTYRRKKDGALINHAVKGRGGGGVGWWCNFLLCAGLLKTLQPFELGHFNFPLNVSQEYAAVKNECGGR